MNRRGRAMLAVGAFTAFAGAYATTPVAARGTPDAPSASDLPSPPHPASTTFAVIMPRRDPFAGVPPPRTQHQTAFSPPFPARPVQPGMPFPAEALPAPPDDPAQRSAARVTGVRVMAVVTGARPFALVEDTGTTRLVTLGDRVGSDVVVAISDAGVRLGGGRLMPIAPAPSSAPPTRPAPSIPPLVRSGPFAPTVPTVPTVPGGR